jgi:hypothetical protein
VAHRWDPDKKQWFFKSYSVLDLDHKMRLFQRWLPDEKEEQPRRTRAPRNAGL